MKHYIYVLMVEAKIFYCGYTSSYPPSRLRQHIDKARFPSKREQKNRLVRGCGIEPGYSDKDKVIIEALEAGKEIEIKVVEEAPIKDEIDEAFWIEALTEEGVKLTNERKGSKWVI